MGKMQSPIDTSPTINVKKIPVCGMRSVREAVGINNISQRWVKTQPGFWKVQGRKRCTAGTWKL